MPGDVVECEIDGIGMILSPIVEAGPPTEAVTSETLATRRNGKLLGMTCIVTGAARGRFWKWKTVCVNLYIIVQKMIRLAAYEWLFVLFIAAWGQQKVLDTELRLALEWRVPPA